MSAADAKLCSALTLIDIVNTGEDTYQELKDLLNQFSAQKREHKQLSNSNSVQTNNDDDYVEPVRQFQRRFRTRFYPLEITPELEAQMEQYIIRKQQSENFKFYNNTTSIMGLFGIPEEQADEMFWQSVEKSKGLEKTAEIRRQINDMKKSIGDQKNNNQSDLSQGREAV